MMMMVKMEWIVEDGMDGWGGWGKRGLVRQRQWQRAVAVDTMMIAAVVRLGFDSFDRDDGWRREGGRGGVEEWMSGTKRAGLLELGWRDWGGWDAMGMG